MDSEPEELGQFWGVQLFRVGTTDESLNASPKQIIKMIITTESLITNYCCVYVSHFLLHAVSQLSLKSIFTST